MDIIYANLGAQFRNARKRAGLSLTQAATEAGATYTALSRYEKGDSKFPIHVAMRLAELYGVDFANLLRAASPDTPAQGETPSRADEDAPLLSLSNPNDDFGVTADSLAWIARIVRVAVIRAFRIDPPSGLLRPLNEYVNAPWKLAAYDGEVYDAWEGQELTACAWRNGDKTSRFIPHYNAKVAQTGRRVVNTKSYTRHEEGLGAVWSTMYGVIHRDEPRLILRCFNRSDFPDVPIDDAQFTLLTTLCAEISRRLQLSSAIEASNRQLRLRDRLSQSADAIPDRLACLRRFLSSDEGIQHVEFLTVAPSGDRFELMDQGADPTSTVLSDWLTSESFFAPWQLRERPPLIYRIRENDRYMKKLRKDLGVSGSLYGVLMPFSLPLLRVKGEWNAGDRARPGGMFFVFGSLPNKNLGVGTADEESLDEMRRCLPMTSARLETYAAIAADIVSPVADRSSVARP